MSSLPVIICLTSSIYILLGTTKMDAGRQESAVLQETRTCILGLLVRACNSDIPNSDIPRSKKILNEFYYNTRFIMQWLFFMGDCSFVLVMTHPD